MESVIFLYDFRPFNVRNWKNPGSENSLPKKKRDTHLSAWLKVDEKNKKVEYQVDSTWIKSASDEEQNIELIKLTKAVTAYRRAGYAIIESVKRIF